MDETVYTCPICGFTTVMVEGFNIIHYGRDAHGFTITKETEPA